VLNISSLKSGEGVVYNRSLFLVASEECVATVFIEIHTSLHFVPSLREIGKEPNSTHTNLTFGGDLLLPCHVSSQLISVKKNGGIVGTDC
jgi:hypothetical protein